jgi:VWFA-related protein
MEAHNRGIMAKRYFLLFCLALFPFTGGRGASAQDDSRIRVSVVLVQLSVAVTDRKGNYVNGLRPEDFVVVEDKIQEKIANFEEGNEPTRRLLDASGRNTETMVPTEVAAAAPGSNAAKLTSAMNGASVFILFDTSNYMYKGFVFAQDAIADFIRSLEGVSRVALYSYSRDLSRVAALTPDRYQALRGVRNTVAGDSAALYNSLLMTVKDAAQLTGRKAIVVFSNGPDDSSLVPPEDVAELAQSTGTIIYMISTQQAEAEPVSAAVFERMSKATGGKAYFSKDWKDEKNAFDSIREDLAHLYAISYYPQANPNRGWRNITVKLVGKDMQKYRIRTRNGYRLLQTSQTANGIAAATPEPPAGPEPAVPEPEAK